MNNRPKVIHTWVLIDEDGSITVRSFPTGAAAVASAKQHLEDMGVPTSSANSGEELRSAWEAFAPGSGIFFIAEHLLIDAEDCKTPNPVMEEFMMLLPAIVCLTRKEQK